MYFVEILLDVSKDDQDLCKLMKHLVSLGLNKLDIFFMYLFSHGKLLPP